MKYKTIKNKLHSVEASSISLGIANFNDQARLDFWFNLLDYYTGEGGNFIDTANVYGKWVDGKTNYSELTLSKWLKVRGNRDKIVISTKGAHPTLGNIFGSRVTQADIDRDVDESLTTLGVDYVDIYFLHRDNPAVPVGEIIEILNRHVKAGKLKILGASNWTAARISEANDYAENHNLIGFGISQICHSLAEITPAKSGDPTLVCMNDEEYAGYVKSGIPIMAFSSQAHGFFTKNIDKTAGEIDSKYATPENLAKLARIKKLCVGKGISPAAATVSYLLSGKLNVFPIIGCSSKEQLADSLTSADVDLTRDETDFLEGK